MKTRTDCPKFDGWVALGWDNEVIKLGDRFIYIGTRAIDEGKYLTPETGYKMNEFHTDNTCHSNWGSSSRKGVAVYRKACSVSDGYTSRESPLPMNRIFCKASPLP